MTKQSLDLAKGFAPVSAAEWRDSLDKVLKGASFEKRMVSTTPDGIDIQPLYGMADGVVGSFRAGLPARAGGWDIRQDHLHPDIHQANRAILDDLSGGVTSVGITLDAAGCHGLDADEAPGRAGRAGVMAYTVDDLDTLLRGVPLSTVPVGLDAGASFYPAAALMMALWTRRKIDAGLVRGRFNADPIGYLARTGELPQGSPEALRQMAALAKVSAATYPNVTSVRVNTAPYYEAGATDAMDLACALASGIAYLRAMTDAGLSTGDAAAEMVFAVPVGCDVFMDIARLRALRLLWDKVLAHCGLDGASRGMQLEAIMSHKVMGQRDPWVNMLRATAASFAGSIGGADAVTVLPFDAAIGLPDDFARRIARNTQIVLQEESHLGRVEDPAGGSWYVESLTGELAQTAWAQLQKLEAEGGILAALQTDDLKTLLAQSWNASQADVARRKSPLTGISEFPDLAAEPVMRPVPAYDTLQKQATERLAQSRKTDIAISLKDDGAMIAAALKGASISILARALANTPGSAPETVEPLERHRMGEAFEALRDAADAARDHDGTRPAVFSCNLGTVAQHTARATFARNFFEAGGLQVLPGDGFTDVALCAEAFRASAARVAVICGGDDLYGDYAASLASSLKALGCRKVYLAGRPGDMKDALLAAGVDDFIFMGSNVLDILTTLHKDLGV